MKTIAFPQDTLDTVPDHRIAKLFSCRKAHLPIQLPRTEDIQHQEAVRIGASRMIYPLELRLIAQDPPLWQPIHSNPSIFKN